MSKVIKRRYVAMAQDSEITILKNDDNAENAEKAGNGDMASDEESNELQDYSEMAIEITEAANRQAAETISAAKQEASQIIQQAQLQGEELKEQARLEGYEKGLSQGTLQGEAYLQELKEEEAKKAQEAKQLLEQTLDDISEQALDFALEVSRKILATEIDRNDQAYVSMVKHAVGRLRVEKTVVVRTAPENISKFESGQFPVSTDHGVIEVSLRGDPDLTASQVLIESEYGSVDAGLDSQLDRLSNVIGEANEEE